MKVLRVINSLHIGGAERSIAGNVPVHLKNGYEIDVLLLDGSETFFYNELKAQGVKVYQLGVKNNIYNPILIFKIIKYLRNYDIIHVHLFPSLYWVAIAKIISFSKVKLVFTEHNTINRRRGSFLFKILDSIIYKKYEIVISISNAAIDDLRSHLYFNHDLRVIYNGIDLERLVLESKFHDLDFIKKHKYKKVILQIAGFREQKDQDTLIKSLPLLPEEFVVVFIGDGKRLEFCQQLAKDLNVSQRVEFLGLKDNVGSYIHSADVIVMSSHWEGFGRAAVEGMALKKPVIASNVSGLSDVVGGAGLLFEVGDYKMLAEHILTLFNDEVYYNGVAQNCYLRSRDYDISKMINSYEHIYDVMISQKNFN